MNLKFFAIIAALSTVSLYPVSISGKQRIECSRTDAEHYYVSLPDAQYGSGECLWRPGFSFSPYGITGRLIVFSDDMFSGDMLSTKKNGDIVIKFNSSPELTMKLHYTTSDHIGFQFDLTSGILTPYSMDYLNTPLNHIEASNLAAFIAFPIKSIEIDGKRLKGPYPDKSLFLEIFDSGISKFPNAQWYDKYRSDRNGSSNKNSVKGNQAADNKAKAEREEKEKIQKEIDRKLSGDNKLKVTAPIAITTNDILTKAWGLVENEKSMWDFERQFFFWETRKQPEWKESAGSYYPPHPISYLGRKIDSFSTSLNANPDIKHPQFYTLKFWFDKKDKKKAELFMENILNDFRKSGVILMKLNVKDINYKKAYGAVSGDTFFTICTNNGYDIFIESIPIDGDQYKWWLKRNPQIPHFPGVNN